MKRPLLPLCLVVMACISAVFITISTPAFAQYTPTGAPPPEAKALVEAPKGFGDVPKIESKTDGTSITLSSGGQGSSGNSRLIAVTANGAFDTRFENTGIGLSALANYGRSAAPRQSIQTTTQNVQGRARYDRYVIDQASFFLITTGRHDRFQGIDFRLNLDPGFKYLFVVKQTNALWAEAGYDFQYDLRRDDALLDPMGAQPPLDKTAVDHSSRAFLGMRHAFNEQVTLSGGAEYLQSLVDIVRNRLNFDAIFAAKVWEGLAVGLGFGLRYDHAPLPGKEQLDATTNVSLIYSYSQTTECPPAATPPGPVPDAPIPGAPFPAPPATTGPPPAGGGAAPNREPSPPPSNLPSTAPPETEPTPMPPP